MKKAKPKMKALRPRGRGWRRGPNIRPDGRALVTSWEHDELGVRVLSSAATHRSEVTHRVILTYHLSAVSIERGALARPSDVQLLSMLEAFAPRGADGELAWWEEDNHHPGNARHVFVPTGGSGERAACPCKDEELVVESDGYTYSFDGAYDPERLGAFLRGER